MNLARLEEEFNVRYYHWALGDFRREIDQGFPFLQQFKTGSGSCVVEMMSEMGERKKLFFAKALVKRFHEDAVKALGEATTFEEKEICDEYFCRALELDTLALSSKQRRASKKDERFVRRAKLKGLVKRGLEQVGMQVLEPEDRDGVLSYGNAIKGWNVITRVYTRNQYSQIAYDHAIWSKGKVKQVMLPDGKREMCPIRLNHSISLFWFFRLFSG